MQLELSYFIIIGDQFKDLVFLFFTLCNKIDNPDLCVFEARLMPMLVQVQRLPVEISNKIFTYLSNPVAEILRSSVFFQRPLSVYYELKHVFATEVENIMLRHDIMLITLDLFQMGHPVDMEELDLFYDNNNQSS